VTDCVDECSVVDGDYVDLVLLVISPQNVRNTKLNNENKKTMSQFKGIPQSKIIELTTKKQDDNQYLGILSMHEPCTANHICIYRHNNKKSQNKINISTENSTLTE
jgi:hypothetical protein